MHDCDIPNPLTWYRSSAIAVMEMVDTKMLVACSVPIDLHRNGSRPIGQYLVSISTSVSGIVTRQSSKSVLEWGAEK